MGAEVAVRQAVHGLVAQRLQQHRRPGLGHAPAAVHIGAGGGVGGHRDVHRGGERGVGGVVPIDVEHVLGQLVVVEPMQPDEVVRRTHRRRGGAVDVGWQQRPRLGQVGALLVRRVADEHGAPLQGADRHPGEARVVEDVVSDVVAVRPHPDLGVVREVRAVGEGVAVVGPERVRARGDRDALKRLRPRHRELRDQPAIGQAVVLHDRIAVVGVLALAPEATPHHVVVDGTEQEVARLVVDGQRDVDHLHVVVGPHVTVGVRRVIAVRVVHALKVLDRGWHRRGICGRDDRRGGRRATHGGRPRRPLPGQGQFTATAGRGALRHVPQRPRHVVAHRAGDLGRLFGGCLPLGRLLGRRRGERHRDRAGRTDSKVQPAKEGHHRQY